MPRPHPKDPKCTRCGGALKRVHRASGAARESTDFKRYRCTEPGCGWDGLLARTSRPARATASAAGLGDIKLWMPNRLWLVMGALFLMLVAGASSLLHMAFREERGVLATGGTPLSATHNGPRSTGSTPAAAPALQPRK